MKNTIKYWKDCKHRIVIQDIKGGQYKGRIKSCDEVGVVIQLSDSDIKSVTLFPWTSILKIARC